MNFHLHSFGLSFWNILGEGNGNPLQRSCLENPRDGGAWWAAVSGVAQSRTRLKRLSSSSSSLEYSTFSIIILGCIRNVPWKICSPRRNEQVFSTYFFTPKLFLKFQVLVWKTQFASYSSGRLCVLLSTLAVLFKVYFLAFATFLWFPSPITSFSRLNCGHLLGFSWSLLGFSWRTTPHVSNFIA